MLKNTDKTAYMALDKDIKNMIKKTKEASTTQNAKK